MSRKIPSGNPNPRRRMLAFHFLRALAWISQSGAARTSRRRTAAQRSQSIKRAAYASMALAAGPRRAWSRAILYSLQGRGRVRALSNRKVATDKKPKGAQPEQREGSSQLDELRSLVPGGRTMDLCSLLEETGNYIQCLTAQVQLMKKIAHRVSN